MTSDSCAEPFETTKTLLWPDLSFSIRPGPFRTRSGSKSDRDHAPDDGFHVSRSRRQAMAACDRVHPCNSLAAPAESVFSGILFNILTALQAVQMGPASVNERPRRAQAASWALQSQMVPLTSRATEVATLLLLPRPGHSSPHECTPLPHMQVPSALTQGMISASCQPPLLPVAVHAKTPHPRSLECVPHNVCLCLERLIP